nr:hypothetical protein [Tanacetum cinerariifolium]
MARLAFCDYHNMIAILEKSEHNVDFHQIVDFVKASHIRYALTINPIIYVSHIRQFWFTARIETTDEGTKILATVDGKSRTIFESSIRRNLKLNDEEGISSLPDAELFENLALMGRATWIAQSKALPTAADEPTSLFRDDSQGEAFPTVSGLKARQDRQNIIKTSALPHDSTPRQTKMATKIAAQDLEISNLKARIKILEDKDKGSAELSGDDALIKGRSLETGDEAGVERSTERESNKTEEMVNVFTSMDAANILTSEVQAVSVPPVAEVSTVGLVPTVSAIFTTASVVTPYSRRKDLIDGLDRNNEVIAKHLQEYEPSTAELTIGEKIDLINELQIEDFVLMGSKEEGEKVKRKGLRLEQGSAKKIKTSEEVFKEDLKEMMQLVPVEEVYMEALQVKHPIIDWEIYIEVDREDLNQLWTLVKETLSIRQASSDKKKELQVELKRLFEPDFKEQLLTHIQALMHDPLEWRLCDTCGFHHVFIKDQEI